MRRFDMYQRLEFGLAALLLVAIVLLVGIASITRFLGSPIIWSVEIAQLCFVWICMLAADLALQENRHFGLSIVLDGLSPLGRRLGEIINSVIRVVLLSFLLGYAVRSTVLMHPRLIGAAQMHASLVHAAMPFGLALMLRTLLVRLYRSLMPRGTL